MQGYQAIPPPALSGSGSRVADCKVCLSAWHTRLPVQIVVSGQGSELLPFDHVWLL